MNFNTTLLLDHNNIELNNKKIFPSRSDLN